MKAALVGIMLPLFVPLTSADAQFGFFQLPKDDFIWYWGNGREGAQRRGFADFQISGSEAGFRCDLTARLRASSALSQTEIKQIENDLRTRLDFVYAASAAMNYFEQTGSLNWGMLDCKRPVAEPADEAERAERESRAREKMLREIERRRARSSRADSAE